MFYIDKTGISPGLGRTRPRPVSSDLVQGSLAIGSPGTRPSRLLLASLLQGGFIITKEAWSEVKLNKPRPSKETLDLLRTFLGFTDREIGRALGVTDRSVKRWRAGGQISTESEERLFDFMRIVAALAEQELPPENIRAWFFYRNLFLDERRPIDVFRTGEYNAVRPAIHAIEDAAFV